MANVIQVQVTGLGTPTGFNPAGVPTPGARQGASAPPSNPVQPPNLTPTPKAPLPPTPAANPPVTPTPPTPITSGPPSTTLGGPGAPPLLPPAGPPMPPAGASAGAAGAAGAAAAAAGPIAILFAIVKGIEAALKLFNAVLNVYTMRIQSHTSQLIATIQNNELEARSEAVRRKAGTVSGILRGVAPFTGLLGKQVLDATADLADSSGGAINATRDAFMKSDAIYRQRFAEIARYNSQLAQIKGMSEFRKVSRDIQEANILGDRLGTLSRQQIELDTVQQQISIAKKHVQLAEQSKDIQQRTNELQKSLDDTLKGVDKKTAELIRRLGKRVDSPLTEIVKMAPKIPDAPRNAPDPAGRDRLNVPIIQGVP